MRIDSDLNILLANGGKAITEQSEILTRGNYATLVLSKTTQPEFNMTFASTKNPQEIEEIFRMIKETGRPSALYVPLGAQVRRAAIRSADWISVSIEEIEKRELMQRKTAVNPNLREGYSIVRADENDMGQKAYHDLKQLMAKGFEIDLTDIETIMKNEVLTNPLVRMTCLYRGDKPIGTVTVSASENSDEPTIVWNMTVAEEKERKKGHGTMLLNEASTINPNQLLVANYDAWPFYLRNQFIKLGTYKIWYVNPREKVIQK